MTGVDAKKQTQLHPLQGLVFIALHLTMLVHNTMHIATLLLPNIITAEQDGMAVTSPQPLRFASMKAPHKIAVANGLHVGAWYRTVVSIATHLLFFMS